MYILDTNICIFAIKGNNKHLLDKLHSNLDKNIYISSLTIAELEYGVSNSMYPEENRVSLLKFLTIFEVLNFDDNDAIEYGKIKTDLKKKGKIIGSIDLLLAAQAVSKNFILVTNNVKEFKSVNNLIIEDWSI